MSFEVPQFDETPTPEAVAAPDGVPGPEAHPETEDYTGEPKPATLSDTPHDDLDTSAVIGAPGRGRADDLLLAEDVQSDALAGDALRQDEDGDWVDATDKPDSAHNDRIEGEHTEDSATDRQPDKPEPLAIIEVGPSDSPIEIVRSSPEDAEAIGKLRADNWKEQYAPLDGVTPNGWTAKSSALPAQKALAAGSTGSNKPLSLMHPIIG